MSYPRLRYTPSPFSRVLLSALLSSFPIICAAATPQEVISWFRQAQLYERMGRTELAVGLYRRIWQEMPARSDAAIRGSQLLLELDRGAEAVEWLASATATSPPEPLLWIEYGDALDRTGASSEADSVWSAGTRRSSNPMMIYLAVTDRLVSRGALARALAWASWGAEASGDAAAFARRLFDIHLALGRATGAARYASVYVGPSTERVQEIMDAIRQASSSRVANDSMASVAVQMSDAEPAAAGRALLAAELDLAAGRRGDAAGLYIRSARASREPANALLSIAGQLDERGYGDVAAALYDEIVRRYPLTPLAYRSAFLAATRYERSDDPRRALSLYRWLIERGRTGYEDPARLALGRLLLAAGDASGAKEQLTAVSRTGRTPSVRREAAFGLAECALRLGRLSEAEAQWNTLARDSDAFPDAPRAQLRLADVAMYRGDARAMEERCREIVERSAGSDEANDCLALTAVLADAGQDTAGWATYGRLRYHLDAGYPDSVLSGVSRLAASPLFGRGMLLASQAEIDKARPEAAAETLAVVVTRFGDTALGEEAEWKLAELYRVHLHDARKALHTYEELLRRYPQSVYSGPARRWVRRLRDTTGAT